jgi:hypothetical protein
MRIASGVTDQYIYFVAVDSTDLKTRETGLSSFTVYRSRNGGAAAAYTTPTINETDTTNMPGVYELLLDEDMTIDSGDETQEICLHITQASMAPVTRVIELYRPKITAGEAITVSSGAVTTVTTATNVTTVNGLAANVITAASMNSDASAEIADAVWDEDATAHQTQGTFGQAIGDPVADTNTIFKAVVTDATGATVGVDAAAILADTGTDGVIVASINAGAITASAVATGAIDADALAADAVAEIADGVWDEDATGHQTTGTFGQAIGDPVADTSTIYGAVVTGAAGATIAADIIAVQADTDDIQTRLPAALVSGRIDASVGAMAANTLTAAATAADFGTEISDAVWAKALTELAAVPGVTGTTIDALNWVFTLARNKIEQTSSTSTLRKDDGTTSLATSAVSDDGTTFTRNEWA